MAKVFITLTGTKYYHGNEFLKPGMKVKLTKEPDNEYDKEAIKVSMKGIGDIGHVANSSYTVIGDSMSAGRLYDKIGDKATAKIVLVTPHGTICKVSKKSLINWQIPPGMEDIEFDYDEVEELVDDLTAAGLDALELECMDADERREALEDAGLDPDDYDFD